MGSEPNINKKYPADKESVMIASSLRNLAALTLCGLLLLVRPALASITATDAWALATTPQENTGAVYLTLRNTGGAEDALTGSATSQSVIVVFDATKLMTINDLPIVTMGTIRDLKIPANGTLSLVPGGTHIILDTLRSPLIRGATFPMTLYFADSKPVTVSVHVVDASADGS